jgi:hypothetical protein
LNVGYINNIELNNCVGIIGNTDTFISAYSEDKQLNRILSCILKRECLENNNEEISVYQPGYLHEFSYVLPYPYYLSKLRYELSENEDDLKELFFKEVNTL